MEITTQTLLLNILKTKHQFFIIFYLKCGWKTITIWLIDKFLDQSIRQNEKTYDEIIEIANGNDFLSGGLLDYSHFNRHYRVMAMGLDLSKQ